MISTEARNLYNMLMESKRKRACSGAKPDKMKLIQAEAELVDSFANFAGVEIEKLLADGVPIEKITIEGAQENRYVYYIHGGGFAMGSPSVGHLCAVEIARKSKRNLISVDYRLAPEHPFPQGLEDCLTVYQWMLAQGIRAEDIVFLGESAGGNLVLALMLDAISREIPLPSAACAISPPVDLHYSFPSFKERMDRDCILDEQAKADMYNNYIQGEDLNNPLISPYYGDCTKFPPVYLIVSTEEVLYDDSIRMHEKLLAEGVECKLTVWEDLWHTFYIANIPESWKVFNDVADFFGKY